jgi:RecA/RadA recombinase
MPTTRGDVDAAVAGLQARWGAAAPRVLGALALASVPVPADDAIETPVPATAPLPGERVIRTGFPALDAILGTGGLPTSASVAIRGDGSSGRTTLALRVAAEAQAAGSVVAWLDLSRSFDPVEAVARGVRLEWLVVITPATLDEGCSIAGALLAGRSVDLLVLDLPGGRLARTDTPARIADRLHRLAALARRAETLLLVLDAPGLARGLATAVAESTGIRLELARRSWVRLGRDIVGQRTEATVARDRHGPPGRTATLRILYAEGGERDACLRHDALLLDARTSSETPDALVADAPVVVAEPGPLRSMHEIGRDGSDTSLALSGCAPSLHVVHDTGPDHVPTDEAPDRETDHATPARLRPASLPGPGTGPTARALPAGAARPGRPAVGSRPGHRRESRRAGARRPAGTAAGERPPARP